MNTGDHNMKDNRVLYIFKNLILLKKWISHETLGPDDFTGDFYQTFKK